jgi:hypothetical protein
MNIGAVSMVSALGTLFHTSALAGREKALRRFKTGRPRPDTSGTYARD